MTQIIQPPLWPWLAVIGLGAFHGINPAMGWLFAVALGLHRHSRRVVLLSLAPIAIGHAVSVAAIVVAVVGFGLFIDTDTVMRVAGLLLIALAAFHLIYGHRHRVRVGMQTGMAGLALWSFLMASAHGAGLMLVPAVLPLCVADPALGELTSGSLLVALIAVAVHTLAMLVVIGTIAVVVYEWMGLAFLRRSWINFDILWSAALTVSGMILLLV